jgi:hypothetical protein
VNTQSPPTPNGRFEYVQTASNLEIFVPTKKVKTKKGIVIKKIPYPKKKNKKKSK